MPGAWLVDALGFGAAALTLLAFAQRAMLPMRVSAIAANLCFALYGALASIEPVLALHLVLLPVNVKRLRDEWRLRRAAARKG
jgi:hypothetical protein